MYHVAAGLFSSMAELTLSISYVFSSALYPPEILNQEFLQLNTACSKSTKLSILGLRDTIVFEECVSDLIVFWKSKSKN